MQTSLPAPTKSQVERFHLIYQIGCLACWIEIQRYSAPHVHHVLSGGKRIGHDATIGLCPWHHDSVTNLRPTTAAIEIGPPLGGTHAHKKAFETRYGTELELLELQNRLVDQAKGLMSLDDLRSTVLAYSRQRLSPSGYK